MSGADETIVLGAKDQASKILDSVGDNAKKLGQRVGAMSKQSVAATQKVEIGFKSLIAATGPFVAVFAAFKAATSAFSVIGDSADAWDTQKEAVRGLTKAIELSGSTIGPTVAQHEAFASALQSSANVGDEVTLGLMKQASMLGVSNDKLQQVTAAAIGMSEATGASLDDSLRKVNETMNGNTEAFAEFLPQLRQAATDEEKLAMVTKLANDGLAQKADKAGTAAGSAERLSNSWGNFLEVIGKALEPVRAFISTGLAVLVETVQSQVIPALDRFMPSAETVAAAMEKMKTGIMVAISAVETVVNNLPVVMELVSASVQLRVTQISETFKHVFTGVIPQYAAWFGDNFLALLSDIWQAAVVTTQNRIKQMADIITNLWDWVKSGFKGGASKLFSDVGDIMGRDLLDGFESATSELPEIAGRTITDAEQALASRVGDATQKLANDMANRLGEKMKAAGESSGVALVEGLESNVTTAAEQVVADATEKANAEIKKVSAASELKATEGRLLTRGTANDPLKEEAVKQNRTLENMSKQMERAEKIQQMQLDALKAGGLGLELIA